MHLKCGRHVVCALASLAHAARGSFLEIALASLVNRLNVPLLDPHGRRSADLPHQKKAADNPHLSTWRRPIPFGILYAPSTDRFQRFSVAQHP